MIFHNTFRIKLLFFYTTLAMLPLQGASIIFDLGGVLMYTRKSITMRHMGLLALPIYAIRNLCSPRRALFDALHRVAPFTETATIPYDDYGKELPLIMCDWLKGIPYELLKARVGEALCEEPGTLQSMADAIFNPEKFSDAQFLIRAGEEFVHDCIDNGHQVYILSNWDAASFKYLYDAYEEFFKLFSGIVVSGQCGLLKPDIKIYQHLLTKYGLKPADCFFIDNQQENIEAAETVGIQSCLVQSGFMGAPRFNKVWRELTTWLEDKESGDQASSLCDRCSRHTSSLQFLAKKAMPE